MYHPVVFLGGGGVRSLRGETIVGFSKCVVWVARRRCCCCSSSSASPPLLLPPQPPPLQQQQQHQPSPPPSPSPLLLPPFLRLPPHQQQLLQEQEHNPQPTTPPSLTCPPRQLVGRDAGCGGVRRLFSVPGEPSTLKTKSKPQTPNSKP